MGEGRPSGTVTFLFTDVEGSTRLWGEHPETMRGVLAEHDAILRSAFEEHDGYIFTTAGDSFATAFAHPTKAVEAAVAAQLGLAALDGEPEIRIRIGVHTGTADERDGDYFGPAVNQTARLMAAGHGGQVLVSSATEELVRNSLDTENTLRDLGEHRFKDLFEPVGVYQLEREDLPASFLPLRTLDARSHNLPVQLTSFVGREEEIEELAKLNRGSRMVTLSGVGGSGKTRLALQTAAELLDEFDDGVWLIELAPLTTPDRIPSTVATVLEVHEKPNHDVVDTLTAWLRNKNLLLILDNCEHLIADAARFVETVLAACAGVKVLATSREILGVSGEYAYHTRSLVAPDSAGEAVQTSLLRYPAVRLFVERAELVSPGFRITTDNAASVVQIVSRLDGMPLAIELAAARLRMLTVGQISDRLDDRFRLLTGGRRTAVPRQQTLEAAIDWSYDLLTQAEKTLFARLAVFMGGFTLESAEAVCAGEPLEDFAVFDLLSHLVDKSLVRAEKGPEETRYFMLETLRQYARTRLAESEEVEVMRKRHAEHFRQLAEDAETNIPGSKEAYWLHRLDDELDNLRQAIGWAVDTGEGELAQSTAGALRRYFILRPLLKAEGLEWVENSLKTSDEHTRARARALLAAGTHSTDNTKAAEYLDQAIDAARLLNDDHLLETALHNRGVGAWIMGETEEAGRLFLETLDLSREIGNTEGEMSALENLSLVAQDQGDYDLAVSRATDALELARGLESDFHVREKLGTLVRALRGAGRLDEAIQVHEEMREHWERVSYLHTAGAAGEMAAIGAHLAMDQAELEEAATLTLEAIQICSPLLDYETAYYSIASHLYDGSRLLSLGYQPEVAARLLGAHDEVQEGSGHFRGPAHQREVDAIRTRLEETLHDFETVYQEGRNLGGKEAIDLMIETLKKITAR